MFVYFHSKTASGNTLSLYPFLSAKLYSDSSLVTRYSFSLCTYNQGCGKVKRETRLTQIKFSLSLNHPIVISLTICQLEYSFISTYTSHVNARVLTCAFAISVSPVQISVQDLKSTDWISVNTHKRSWRLEWRGGVRVGVKVAWILVRMCVRKSEKPLIHICCQLEKWTQSFISEVGLNK